MPNTPVHPAILDRAVAELELETPIERAYIEDDTLVIITRYQTHQIPAPTTTTTPAVSGSPGNCQGHTSPQRGHKAPAYAELDSAVPKEGSAHPQASAPNRNAEPEPSIWHQRGLDDYTAIDGVGPSYAQDLHNANLYTYRDLHLATERLDDIVPAHVARKIRIWLDARLL